MMDSYQRVLQRMSRGLKPHQVEQAHRMFSWIAYAERPIKSYELLDGLAFFYSPYVLDDETRFPESLLDLCKPLVEIGPGMTVDFVHSSAKE